MVVSVATAGCAWVGARYARLPGCRSIAAVRAVSTRFERLTSGGGGTRLMVSHRVEMVE